MTWDFTPFAVPLLISALVSAGVAIYTWRRRETAGGLSLVVLSSGAAIWALADALTIMSPTLDQYMFWWDFSYIGIATVPTAWLAFALEYSGNSRWTTKPRIGALAVIPVVSLALVWTEPLHGLMWTVEGIATRDPFIFVNIERGPWFWIFIVQVYCCVIIGAMLLTWLLSRSYRRHRNRALALILLTVALPTGVNIIHALARSYDYTGFRVLDLTPYTFAISTPAIAVAIFRYRVQDFATVARDRVIERIQDGIVLLDPQLVILDINAAGARFLHSDKGAIIGMRLHQVAPALSHRIETADYEASHYEVALNGRGSAERWFDVRLSTIVNSKGIQGGYSLVLRDSTDRKQLEQQLEFQARHDFLTGLANRTLLEEELERRLGPANQRGLVALAFIDLDGFKEINDRLGHQAGDETLQEVARRLEDAATGTDVVARWGGDEFAVLTQLPSAEAAQVWGTRLLAACDDQASEHQVTASIGIALATPACTSTGIIRQADDGMYQAKRAGKSRHVIVDMSQLEPAEDDQLAS